MSTSLPDLSGRITLVTGATRGIGWQACLALAKAGSHIIAAGRTQGALEELDDTIRGAGGECSLVPIDLRQFDDIDQSDSELPPHPLPRRAAAGLNGGTGTIYVLRCGAISPRLLGGLCREQSRARRLCHLLCQ